MYKLLIVDDDDIERSGLAHIKEWQALNIQCVGEACNGAEGLELCEQLSPDIVITDVKMPIMDGITLAKQLRQQYPSMIIIIISGYEDFAAARSAVNADVAAYLLKPIDIKELTRVISTYVGKLEHRNAVLSEQDRLRSRLQELLPVERKRFLRDQMLGIEVYDEKRFLQTIKELQIPIKNSLIVVLLVEIAGSSNQDNYTMYRLIKLRILELLQDVSQKFSSLEAIQTRDGEYALLFIFPDKMQEGSIFSVLEETGEDIIKIINEELSLSASVGISIPTNTMVLGRLYEQARMALQQKFILGLNRVIWFDQEIKQEHNSSVESSHNVTEEIIKLIRMGDTNGIQQKIDGYLTSLSRMPSFDLEFLQSACMDILASVIMSIREIGENIQSLVGYDSLPYSRLFIMETLPDIKNWLTDFLCCLTVQLKEKRCDRYETLVLEAKEYIAEAYSEDISTDSVAAQLYISPSHLRRIFKNKTGQTVQDYITHIRMDHAAQLLRDGLNKVYEVAEKVGYENSSYFCMIFKRYFGVTPGEYRNKIQ